MVRRAALVSALLVALAAGSAHAQTPPSAPDVVVMKDGSMLKGTIAEVKKGTSVTIVMITGETRTIQMAEVEYAGAASKQPGAEPIPSASPPLQPRTSPVVMRSGEARLSFASRPEFLTLYRSESAIPATSGAPVARTYKPICTAPCEATLPIGTHTLALSDVGARPVDVRGMVQISGPSRVVARYESYETTRLVGWIIGLGSLVVGSALLMDAATDETRICSVCVNSSHLAKYVAGALVLGGGGAAGWFLGTKRDEAYVTVTPVTASSLGAARDVGLGSKTRDVALPTGASLQGVF